jgi:hypothetical protein
MLFVSAGGSDVWGLLDIFAFGIGGSDDNNGNGGCLVVVIMFVIVATLKVVVSLFESEPAPVVEKRPAGGQQIVEKAGEQTGKSLRSFTRGIWKGIRTGVHED